MEEIDNNDIDTSNKEIKSEEGENINKEINNINNNENEETINTKKEEENPINNQTENNKEVEEENKNKPNEFDSNNIIINNKDLEEKDNNNIDKNNINEIIEKNDNIIDKDKDNINEIIEKKSEDENLNININISKEKPKKKPTVVKYANLDSFFNDDDTEKNNNIINTKSNKAIDKRQYSQVYKPLKYSVTKDDSFKDNNNQKLDNNIVRRSMSQAVIDSDNKGGKRSFLNELSSNPKYYKIIDLKEETDTQFKKTVGNEGSSSFLKSLVSRKKARFCYDGFDLDLTYITMQIIAMGFPSTSIEGLYRNNMDDVKRFFNTRHPKHHKIYNLCEEKRYPENTFYQQGYYPFPDHEAPPLPCLMPFCQDAKKFLEEDENNVVAIHCKAGKGRTGTFICCLLLYLGIFDTADECMKYYGLMRVGAEKGVSIPSQKRYVNYFEKMVRDKIEKPINYKSATITEIKLYTVPNFAKFSNSCTPTFIIENGKRSYKHSDYNRKRAYYCTSKSIEFPLKGEGFTVNGDTLVTFYHLGFFGKDKMFKFWFNSHFLPENGVLEIDKKNLDKAFKDKENKNFSPDFKIEMKYFFP